MPLLHFVTLRLNCESIRNAVSFQSQHSLLESPWRLYSQRIRYALRLHGDSTETALGLHCKLFAVESQSIRQSVRAALVHSFFFFFLLKAEHFSQSRVSKSQRIKAIFCFFRSDLLVCCSYANAFIFI